MDALRRIPGLASLSDERFEAARALLEDRAVLLQPGQHLDLKEGWLALLVRGVVAVRSRDAGDLVEEGPAWIWGPLPKEESEARDLPSYRLEARTPARLCVIDGGVDLVGRFATVDLASGRLAELRDDVLRETEPFEDFLRPQDAAIPATTYEADEAELVLVVVEGGAAVEAARARGHDCFDRELVIFSHYPRFGAFGRSTRYDELARFVPLGIGLHHPEVYAHRLVPDSASAVLVGRELFGFPKELGVARIGRRAAWSGRDGELNTLLTWEREEPVGEPDVFAAELAAAIEDTLVSDLLGGLAVHLADLLPASRIAERFLRNGTKLVARMPDGREALFRVGFPRQLRRLGEARLGEERVLGAWRARVALALIAEEGGADTRLPEPEPPFEAQPLVVTSELEDPTLRVLAGAAGTRELDLQPGHSSTIGPGDMAILFRGTIAKLILEDGRPRYVGARTGTERPQLVGLADVDSKVRVEAASHAKLLVVRESALGQLDEDQLTGLLWEALRGGEGDLRLARQTLGARAEGVHHIVFELDAELPWSLPEGLEPAAAKPLLVARIPARFVQTPNVGALVASRVLHEDEIRYFVDLQLGRTDLACLWLPYGGERVEGYHVPIAWATSPSVLLAAREEGWPARLGRWGVQKFHLFVDGASLVRPKPPPGPPLDHLPDPSMIRLAPAQRPTEEPPPLPNEFELSVDFRRSTLDDPIRSRRAVRAFPEGHHAGIGTRLVPWRCDGAVAFGRPTPGGWVYNLKLDGG